MGRILLGDRNMEHRNLLKEKLTRLDPSLSLISAGNSEDILRYLIDFPRDPPLLIIFDPGIPSPFHDPLVSIIKSDPRFSQIPLVIWTDQVSRRDYYAARATFRWLFHYEAVPIRRMDATSGKIYDLATRHKEPQSRPTNTESQHGPNKDPGFTVSRSDNLESGDIDGETRTDEEGRNEANQEEE